MDEIYIRPECRILGIDTGLATLGWAILGAGDDDDLGYHGTASQADTRGTSQAEDVGRRARELADHVSRLIAEHDPVLVAVEALSVPRNAATAWRLGAAWGALTSNLHLEHPVVLYLTPQRVRALLGVSSTSKGDAVTACDPTGVWRERAEALTKGQRVHALDALAVATAAARTPQYDLLIAGRRSA